MRNMVPLHDIAGAFGFHRWCQPSASVGAGTGVGSCSGAGRMAVPTKLGKWKAASRSQYQLESTSWHQWIKSRTVLRGAALVHQRPHNSLHDVLAERFLCPSFPRHHDMRDRNEWKLSEPFMPFNFDASKSIGFVVTSGQGSLPRQKLSVIVANKGIPPCPVARYVLARDTQRDTGMQTVIGHRHTAGVIFGCEQCESPNAW